mgnify:CR=1 FL=1
MVDLTSITSKLSASCGENESLGAIGELADSIKGKLAEGMDALGDLESLQSDMLSKLGELKAELPEIPTSSLQDDLKELANKVGEEFADAQAAIREKWGDAVDDIDELVDSIPSLTDLISGDVELPDFCKDIPNVEIRTTVDEAGNEVQEVVQQAQAAVTPNTNSVPIEEFTSGMQQAFANISSGPSGESFIGTSIAYGTQVEVPLAAIFNRYFGPAQEKLDELKAYQSTSVWRSVRTLMRESSLTLGELLEQGLLSQEQIGAYNENQLYTRELASLNRLRGRFQEAVYAHKMLIVGNMSQEDFDAGKLDFYDDLGGIYEEDLAKQTYEDIMAFHLEKSDLIIRFNAYRAFTQENYEASQNQS